MDCSRCQFRSAVGYCGVTHDLLCEECGVHCDQCGWFVGEEHIYETSKGVRLCPKCQEERKARKTAKHKQQRARDREPAATRHAAPDTSLAALESTAPAPGELDDDEALIDEDAALAASGYQKWQPWQFSMLLAVFGIICATLIIIFPSFRGIKVGGGDYFPMAYIVVFLPLLAFVWALIGLTYAKFWEDREKCLVSTGLGILAIIMLFGSWFTDPVRQAEEQTAIAIRTRDDMNAQELAEWREGILNRYRY
ncbi:MAG TPA: hypothetical protein PLD73_17185 [Candidatus Hydrogenedentes bacterium]|nr:hypothetical protein [Candidatus Hydrogenedentota bacterium]